MNTTSSSVVDLGFVTARVPIGSHVCQVYDNDDERDECAMRFLLCGIRANESTACFSDHLTASKLRAHFEEHGVSFDAEISSGRLAHSGADATYFQDEQFNPDRTLRMLVKFHQDSLTQRRTGTRVIGEMSARIGHIEGGSRLLEYESRVSSTLRQHPITAVCQYNAHAFDGATIMDVLTVHPMLVIRGSVVQNPFYVPPEEHLRS